MSKYKKWYDNIIYNAKNRILSGYVEVHHIIPRSLGGSDELENLVQLTAREHFICHILLTKFTTGQDKHKMLHAAILMKAKSVGQKRYINSRLYEHIRKEYSKAKKGVHNNSWNTGLTKENSEKLRLIGENISKAKKGRPSKRKGLPGVKLSEEAKLKMSIARKGKYLWWNDGFKSIRANECPGSKWVKGRLKSNMSDKFNGREIARKYNKIILIDTEGVEISLCNISSEFKDFCKHNNLHNIMSIGKSKNFRVKSYELNPKYRKFIP